MSMYQGTNVTAIRSQRWLGSSMTELMTQQSYQSITIARLCEHAGLSRQTFYNVFDSKDEVLRFCIRNQYERQFKRFSGQKKMTIDESIEAFVSIVGNCYTLQSLMIKNGLESIVLDEISRCIALFSDHFVMQDHRGNHFPYVKAMISGSMGYILVYWMMQEEPIPMEELTALTKSFLNGTLFQDLVVKE